MAPPSHAWVRRAATGLGAAAVLAGSFAPSATAARPRSETLPLGSAGSLVVHWRGNGHGHGMSQYGAEGAALQGRSAGQILAFYYPGSQLITTSPATVRVHLTAGPNTTVVAGTAGLRVPGYGPLPTRGYGRFRFVPAGSGLALQGKSAGVWHTMRRGLPARAEFVSSTGWVALVLGDGFSLTKYRGAVDAVRTGAGEMTVNRVPLDWYTEGVAPREVPAGWSPAAVQAQAIAARTYALAEVQSAAGAGAYDICDTSACQAYGGMAHYDRHGRLQWTDDPAAIATNRRQVLTYGGRAILAQYSASNGGATVSAGLPYLIGRADPYDTTGSGDPYLDQSRTVSATALARSFGLASLTSVTIARRDGIGPWGGRVLAATLIGRTAAGATRTVSTTGFGLGDALGVWTDYLQLTAAP